MTTKSAVESIIADINTAVQAGDFAAYKAAMSRVDLISRDTWSFLDRELPALTAQLEYLVDQEVRGEIFPAEEVPMPTVVRVERIPCSPEVRVGLGVARLLTLSDGRTVRTGSLTWADPVPEAGWTFEIAGAAPAIGIAGIPIVRSTDRDESCTVWEVGQ